MKAIFVILFVVFCNLNLFAQIKVTKDEYAIYAAVLESISLRNGFKTSFVISDNTVKLDFVPLGNVKPKSVSDLADEKVSVDLDELVKDFRERNKYSVKLRSQLITEREYHIVNESEINALFEQGKKEYEEVFKKCKCEDVSFSFSSSQWQPLYKKYPNSYGYYNFSRIGFNPDKTAAMVFANKISGDQGDVDFYIIEKTNDRWIVTEKIFVFSWID